jgi:ubiquinone/menaquinone biosynthesis C-methylase UbiE
MAEDNYVFQRSSEAERLRRQGRLVENMTRPLLEKIGLCPGMSCLDIGCGPGEAMRLMGEMVGDTGIVVGVDIDARAGRSGIDRLHAEIECNFQFIEQDLSGPNPLPPGPFDLVFGRLVLIHLPEPIAMLRKMYAVTKPGGVILVQDYNGTSFDIQPRPKQWNSFQKMSISAVAKATGRDISFGTKLPLHFVAAGIGAPDDMSATAYIGWLEDCGDWLLTTLEGLLPSALKLALITEAEARACIAEIEEIAQTKHRYIMLSDLIMSVWQRKPAS